MLHCVLVSWNCLQRHIAKTKFENAWTLHVHFYHLDQFFFHVNVVHFDVFTFIQLWLWKKKTHLNCIIFLLVLSTVLCSVQFHGLWYCMLYDHWQFCGMYSFHSLNRPATDVHSLGHTDGTHFILYCSTPNCSDYDVGTTRQSGHSGWCMGLYLVKKPWSSPLWVCKQVDQEDGGAFDAPPDGDEGLVGALARALKGFRPHCVDSGEMEYPDFAKPTFSSGLTATFVP